MSLLLDTHIFLWSLLAPERLGAQVRRRLLSPDVQLWISPITVWECLVLAEKGRVVLTPDPETWLRQSLRQVPLREAPLNLEIALVSRAVSLRHQDPADRLIVATAKVFGLTLVTADARLLALTDVALLPNV